MTRRGICQRPGCGHVDSSHAAHAAAGAERGYCLVGPCRCEAYLAPAPPHATLLDRALDAAAWIVRHLPPVYGRRP